MTPTGDTCASWSLTCQTTVATSISMPDGRQFRLGTGFTDVQRSDAPPIGSLVTYRYNGLTSKGLPRFARFMRIRHDPPPPDPR